MRREITWNTWFPEAWQEANTSKRLLMIDTCSAGEFAVPVHSDPKPHISLGHCSAGEVGWAGLEEEGLVDFRHAHAGGAAVEPRVHVDAAVVGEVDLLGSVTARGVDLPVVFVASGLEGQPAPVGGRARGRAGALGPAGGGPGDPAEVEGESGCVRAAA